MFRNIRVLTGKVLCIKFSVLTSRHLLLKLSRRDPTKFEVVLMTDVSSNSEELSFKTSNPTSNILSHFQIILHYQETVITLYPQQCLSTCL